MADQFDVKRREGSEESDDQLEATTLVELAIVHSLGQGLAVGGLHHPTEANPCAVVMVGAARQDDASALGLPQKAVDVSDQGLSSFHFRGRIRVDAVVRPRSFEELTTALLVGLAPSCGVELDRLLGRQALAKDGARRQQGPTDQAREYTHQQGVSRRELPGTRRHAPHRTTQTSRRRMPQIVTRSSPVRQPAPSALARARARSVT